MMLGADTSDSVDIDTISLRDDHPRQQAASERAINSAVASERLAWTRPARYPIYELLKSI